MCSNDEGTVALAESPKQGYVEFLHKRGVNFLTENDCIKGVQVLVHPKLRVYKTPEVTCLNCPSKTLSTPHFPHL